MLKIKGTPSTYATRHPVKPVEDRTMDKKSIRFAQKYRVEQI